MNIIIALFGFVLIILCLFTLLVIMVQKPKGDGGLGAALGGGSMEAALGAETGSLLTKITIYTVIGFFVLTFVLYLGNLTSKQSADAGSGNSLLSEIVDESTSDDSATFGISAESALQQVLQASEESAENEAATVENVVTEAAEDAANAVEESTNP